MISKVRVKALNKTFVESTNKHTMHALLTQNPYMRVLNVVAVRLHAVESAATFSTVGEG